MILADARLDHSIELDLTRSVEALAAPAFVAALLGRQVAEALPLSNVPLCSSPRGRKWPRPRIQSVAEPEEIDEPRYHRILVALDSSDSALFALRHIVAHARRLHGHLTLLTVVPGTPSIVARAGLSPEQLAHEIDDEAAQHLRATAAALPQDVSVTTLLRHGDPVSEILAALEEDPYDLLAMGARGRGRVTSALLGSVSAGVLHRSPVPVIVFHPPTTSPG